MTTRKGLALWVALSFGLTAAVEAGQRSRSRSESEPAAGGAVRQAAPGGTVTLVGPNRLQVRTADGDTYELNGDGSVTLAEIDSMWGSPQRMYFERTHLGMDTITLPDGTVAYEDGTVGFFSDLIAPGSYHVPEEPRRKTLEDLKREIPWMEVTMHGHTQVIFADGTVIGDPEYLKSLNGAPAWARHREEVPRMTINGQTVYADGAVFLNEPQEP
jgi:hypothetical protein